MMDILMREQLDKLWEYRKDGKFQNYIEYIIFPYYKNLFPNSKIDFTFPITILVGKNGSGKSSTLHALYGAPKGNSPGHFWFSTSLDPIEESGARNRFFYGYKETISSNIKEVRKSRIRRSKSYAKKENLDYWETTRPSISDGMQKLKDGDRHEPVDKKVVYIDFRSELSAFDKYFYFGEPKNERTQDYLRRKTKYLNNLFSGGIPNYPGGHFVNYDIIDLNQKHIDKVNQILDKNYISIKMVSHRIFEHWGTSVLVKIDNFTYSEANAGSGEIAIINLVYKVMIAEPFSLILLDEPEVSLHPSAQIKLKLFLIEQSISKKHQIIISSHSTIFIEGMPKESLKVFETGVDNKFLIKENVNPFEAFYTIEESCKNKINIFCEDVFAKRILERVAESSSIEQYFNIQYISGGAEVILGKYLPIYSASNIINKPYFILDGDKDYVPKVDLKSLNIDNLQSLDFLSKVILSLTNIKIKFNVDGNSGNGRIDQQTSATAEYIEYHYNNVFYFPGSTAPEHMLFKSNFVKSGSLFTPVINENMTSIELKNQISRISKDIFKSEDYKYYDNTRELLLAKWIDDENEDFKYIASILSEILDKSSNNS